MTLTEEEYQEELFRLVCGSLIDLYKWFNSLARDIIVFSLLVIGWLITSRFSRGYLRSNELILGWSLAMLGLLFAMYIAESVRLYRLSRRKMKQLDEIAFTHPQHYRQYKISPQMIAVNLILVCGVFILLCSIMLTV